MKQNNSSVVTMTVGDNGHNQRVRKTFNCCRTLISDLTVGQVVNVRFRDEFTVTDFRRYKLINKFYRDEFNERRGLYTGVFEKL